MKIHFDPYYDDCYDGPTPCGVQPKEGYESSSNWKNVTCKRCLNQKERLQTSFKNTEKETVRQMGEMADFFNKE